MNQNTFGVPGSSTNNQQPSASSTAFTASMRDKQARGRDPYEQDDECPAGRDGDGDVDMDDDGSDAEDARLRAEGRKLRLGAAPRLPQTAEERAMVQYAANVLDNPELLLRYSQQRGETMTATRLHFTSIMFGKPQKQPRLSVEQHPSLARKPAYTSPTGLSAPHPGKRTT